MPMVLIVKAQEEKLTSPNYAPTGSKLLELMFKQCRREDNETRPSRPLFSSLPSLKLLMATLTLISTTHVTQTHSLPLR